LSFNNRFKIIGDHHSAIIVAIEHVPVMDGSFFTAYH